MNDSLMNVFGLILTSPLIVMCLVEIKRVFNQKVFNRTANLTITDSVNNITDVNANL